MSRLKILIVGRTGQVGWELCRSMAPLGDVTAIDYPEIDFLNEAGVRERVKSARPDILINAAAYTAVDKAESEPAKAHQVNAAAPAIMAAEAAELGALLVHYSTDYVYDGTTKGAYVEEDAPNPLNVYGKSKLAGDHAIVQSDCRFLIFRLCWVYGARGQNFMRTILRLAAEREQLKVVADQFGAPTWSRMIAEATAFAVKHVTSVADSTSYHGIYHLAASGHTSWHGFASRIVDRMPSEGRKCAAVLPIRTDEYPLPARRPARSVLNCAKLEKTFGLKLPDWQESLDRVLEN